MARKPKGRAISGLCLLDKPQVLSSNAALQRVKHLYGAAKAGHTGALDPLATGLLPICLGEATKFSQYLLDSDKRYLTTAKLGQRTDTCDAEGEVTEERPVPDNLSREQIEALLDEHFSGDIEQVPPVYSALKLNGQPLYKLARQGVEVEVKPRQVRIHEIRLLALREDELDLEVFCSKGTYIRSIVEDLGLLLGCGAHVSVLRRLQTGPFHADQMMTLEQQKRLEDGWLGYYYRPGPRWRICRGGGWTLWKPIGCAWGSGCGLTSVCLRQTSFWCSTAKPMNFWVLPSAMPRGR